MRENLEKARQLKQQLKQSFNLYTKTEVAEAAGVYPCQLNYWIHRGVIPAPTVYYHKLYPFYTEEQRSAIVEILANVIKRRK